MILVRSPLRITLGGGGTDLEPYCSTHGGLCIAAAIDKYVYVAVTKPFTSGIYLKYSLIEHVERVQDVQHPIIRKALEIVDIEPQIEITTLADIPAGTGLGSSSSFTTALLQALYTYKRTHISTRALADLAISVESSVTTTGKQDQYIAAYGGLRLFEFPPHDIADKDALRLSMAVEYALNDKLLLFYTGVTHEASSALVGQGEQTKNLDEVKNLAHEMRVVLQTGKLGQVGLCLNNQWGAKEFRCPSPIEIQTLRNRLMRSGAAGVKLIGAGQGGFLLCATNNPSAIRSVMGDVPEVRFYWDYEGTKVLLS